MVGEQDLNMKETCIFFRINPFCGSFQMMLHCHFYKDEFSDIPQTILTKIQSQVFLKMPLCI